MKEIEKAYQALMKEISNLKRTVNYINDDILECEIDKQLCQDQIKELEIQAEELRHSINAEKPDSSK